MVAKCATRWTAKGPEEEHQAEIEPGMVWRGLSRGAWEVQPWNLWAQVVRGEWKCKDVRWQLHALSRQSCRCTHWFTFEIQSKAGGEGREGLQGHHSFVSQLLGNSFASSSPGDFRPKVEQGYLLSAFLTQSCFCPLNLESPFNTSVQYY